MGAQGHGWAAPRPAGGSEDRGPQRAPRPWAANGLGRWARGWGRGGGPRAGWCLEGPRVGERQDLGAPHSTLPPIPPRQAHPAGCSRSRKPCGPPGRAGRVLAGGGGGKGAGAGARRGAACAGHRAAGSPVAGGAAQVQRALRGELESCGRRLARAAGQSERQAQRRALRAPGGSRLRLRPYHPERARSRLISEAKQGRARLVLGWETAWEYRVL